VFHLQDTYIGLWLFLFRNNCKNLR